MTAMTLFVALAVPVRLAAQSNYSVVELGELGGTAGSANGINDLGWVLRAGLWGQFLFSDAGERGSHDQLQTHVGRCSQ